MRFLGLSISSKVSGWYKVEPTRIRVLAPHEILHSLATYPSKAVFNSVMLGNLSQSARVQFWEHVKSCKPWQKHPILSNRSTYDPAKLVGFVIHGDGCQFFKDDEVFVWSISSIFSQEGMIEDVLVYKIPFVAIPERWMRSPTASGLILHGFFTSQSLP